MVDPTTSWRLVTVPLSSVTPEFTDTIELLRPDSTLVNRAKLWIINPGPSLDETTANYLIYNYNKPRLAITNPALVTLETVFSQERFYLNAK